MQTAIFCAVITAILAARWKYVKMQEAKAIKAAEEKAAAEARACEFDEYFRSHAVGLIRITVIELVVEEIEMVPVVDV
jgi:hypothetical protein